MVGLYHPCISTRGVSIYWDSMVACKIRSKQHLHGQLKAGLTMNWNWNGWNRTLRNILLRCLYHDIDLLLMRTITIQRQATYSNYWWAWLPSIMAIFWFLPQKKYPPYLASCTLYTHSKTTRYWAVWYFSCCYSNELGIWVINGGNAIKKGQFHK